MQTSEKNMENKTNKKIVVFGHSIWFCFFSSAVCDLKVAWTKKVVQESSACQNNTHFSSRLVLENGIQI